MIRPRKAGLFEPYDSHLAVQHGALVFEIQSQVESSSDRHFSVSGGVNPAGRNVDHKETLAVTLIVGNGGG